MTKEINVIPPANAPRQRPVPAFGVRVSKTYPTFTYGDATFKSRLRSVNEDLELMKYQQTLDTINKRHEDAGEVKNAEGAFDLSLDDSVELMEAAAPLVAELLKRRFVSDKNGMTADQIDTDWIKDNMVASELSSFLQFLSTGFYFDADSFLESQEQAVGEGEGDTPNASTVA